MVPTYPWSLAKWHGARGARGKGGKGLGTAVDELVGQFSGELLRRIPWRRSELGAGEDRSPRGGQEALPRGGMYGLINEPFVIPERESLLSRSLCELSRKGCCVASLLCSMAEHLTEAAVAIYADAAPRRHRDTHLADRPK